jgi:hypothetical protein
MLSGLNAFEIGDIQEEKTVAVLTGRSECNQVTLRRMDPDQSTQKPVLKRFYADFTAFRFATLVRSID